MSRNHRIWMLEAAAVLLFAMLFSVTPKVFAQDNSSTAVKAAGSRKVKSRVEPEYPELAHRMRISGTVRISATVTPDGHVKETKVLGGSPLLTLEAENAVKKWRFEDGPKETVEIIEIDFK
jgi:TonB family protein